MIALFVAVTVSLTLIVALDLLLTFGVMRRLRQLQATVPTTTELSLPPVGSAVGPFQASPVNATSLTEAALATGSWLVIFLTTTCPSCRRVTEQLAAAPPRDKMLIFVLRTESETDEEAVGTVTPLIDRATVVVNPAGHPVVETFGIQGFPALVRVVDGVVTAAAHRLAELNTADHATAKQPTHDNR